MYCPPGHTVQLPAPAPLNEPAGHTTHAIDDPLEYCPATHTVHAVALATVLYCPRGHVVHDAAAATENVPALQGAHGDAPPGEN